jgi:GxxExxY protein
MITQSYLTDLTYKINGACIEVHKILGAGLLESVYHKCLEQEFLIRNINFKSELKIPVVYKGKNIECDFICDFLVEDAIVLELKAVSAINDIHRAQVYNYMNLLKVAKGIIINFKVKNIYNEGQETLVNSYYSKLL